MKDYVTLIGAEDVRRAGSAMCEAASQMQSAANNLDYVLQQHQRFMDDWLIRFEAVLEKKP